MIALSLKSAKINSYHKKKKSLFYLSGFFIFYCCSYPERYVHICVPYINVHVAFCSILLMFFFESACVSSHIQEKEKVAAAVSTVFCYCLW